MKSLIRYRWPRAALVGAAVLLCAAAPGLAHAAKAVTLAIADVSAARAEAAGPSDLQVGIYDPDGAFADASRVQIEHVFMPWQNIDLASLDVADRYAADRGRTLLLTVEPWSWSPLEPVFPDELREGLLSGRYDDRIGELCGRIAKLRSPVTVRWAHEMDLKNGRYPWSDWRPSDYVAAYRHFVDLCREKAPDLTFMWSPRGEFDLGLYYPGDDYVDEIGLSVFGYQAYDQVANGHERDLTELLKPSYDRAVKFGKPIYISEFGCAGDVAYMERCNDFSAATLKQFPLLEGVVYYSAVEPGQWPAVYGKPDWRVVPGSGPGSGLLAGPN